jgi:hypothetical protein
MDADFRSNKINLDDLFNRKKQIDIMTVKTYNTILDRVHRKIKATSSQRINNVSCWFVVPEVMFGCTRYDKTLCIAYIIQELETNGFKVKYTHPNLLLICWNHWIPMHVREEIKRQTGKSVDGFGELVQSKKDGKPFDPRYNSTANYKPSGNFEL